MRIPSPLLCLAALAGACTAVDGPPECDLPSVYEKSPEDALEGPGWHRIYVQGGSSTPGSDGRYGMNEHRNEIAASDHFLLSQGALVEWTYPVVDALTGTAFLHVAKVDEEGVTARYELDFVHDGEPIPMLSVDDPEDGVQGYLPFEGCFGDSAAAVEPSPGDYLLLTAMNLTGGDLGIVIAPPDYYTWIDVEVAP